MVNKVGERYSSNLKRLTCAIISEATNINMKSNIIILAEVDDTYIQVDRAIKIALPL